MITVPWVGAALVGLSSGVHAATWGMYKDSQYEGFSRAKYARSAAVGVMSAIVIQQAMGLALNTPGGLLMLFGMAYALERGLVEWHKSFIRVENQAKYFIPMAFAVGGRVIPNRRARTAAGIAYVAAILLVVLGLQWTDRALARQSPVIALLVAGTAGGWISAFGGAWKDAPKEGFQLFKFFRSPAVALAYALLMSSLTSNLLVIAFASLGLTIATIETKKMFDRNYSCGKFAGKPTLHPEALVLRQRFVPIYLAIWAAVLTCIAVAIAMPDAGLLAMIELAPR